MMQPTANGMLDAQTFLQVVNAAPLVAVDLAVIRAGREVLLGYRNNRPAQGFWFVPGGRILKDEKIGAALLRVAQKELGAGGLSALIAEGQIKPRLLGAFEHFYDDCFAGDVGVSTHYVVLGHRLDVPADFALAPIADAQHAELRWWQIAAALRAAEVHDYTKAYLVGDLPLSRE